MAEIKQPSLDAQKLLSDIMAKEPELVEIENKKVRIGWLHKDTEARIAHLILKHGDTEKTLVKWYSLVRLDLKNGFLTWLLGWLWHWIHWRWIWYVRREKCTKFQMAVISASKKKIKERSDALGWSTILTVEAMDTMMMMAQHEHGRVVPFGAAITP